MSESSGGAVTSADTGLEERVVIQEGRRLRFLTGGDGPPLVLCHGFMGSAENFAGWFPALLPIRRLVVPDLPGFGASDPLPGPHTADALADAVAALCDRLGVERFDLAGLCLGGSVAQGLLVRRPASIRRLVVHTPLLAPHIVRRRFRLQVSLATTVGLYGLAVWLSRQRVVSDVYKRFVVEGPDVDSEAARVNFENQRRAHPRATREWIRDGLARDDVAALARRSGPTLLLAAANDRIVDVAALRSLVGSLPAVRLEVIDGAGHGWNDAFVRAQVDCLTRFLSGPSQ